MVFYTEVNSDIIEYYYEVTSVFKEIIGDNLERVLLNVGCIYVDEKDTNFIIAKQKGFKQRAEEFIKNIYDGEGFTKYLEDIIFEFKNGRKIKFSSVEGLCVKINKG